MKEYFREISDDQDVYDNLSLQNKCLRVFIRYAVRFLGINLGMKLLNSISSLFKRKIFSYLYYLLKINIFRLNYLIELSLNNYPKAIATKNLWAKYVSSNSVSPINKANADFYTKVISENQEVSVPSVNDSNSKFYIYGPGCEHDPKPEYSDYTLVHLKPFPRGLSIFKNEVLFLNSYYFTNVVECNKEVLENLRKRYKKIYLSCMNSELPNGFERVNLFNQGYISSEMALQRILNFLSENFGKCECVIEGFNFYIDEDAYRNKNYHKLTRDGDGKIQEKELCLSLAEHDFLFNFIITQNLLKNIKLIDSKEFKGIISLDKEEYMQKLFESRDFTTLKYIR